MSDWAEERCPKCGEPVSDTQSCACCFTPHAPQLRGDLGGLSMRELAARKRARDARRKGIIG